MRLCWKTIHRWRGFNNRWIERHIRRASQRRVMRTEEEIKDQVANLMKVYKKMDSTEIYKHPETESMIVALQWVLEKEKAEIPLYPEEEVYEIEPQSDLLCA